MSWHTDEGSHAVTHARRNSSPRSAVRAQLLESKVMHPDDIQKIIVLIIAACAAATCIFTMKLGMAAHYWMVNSADAF
jgi:hypothetical protein